MPVIVPPFLNAAISGGTGQTNGSVIAIDGQNVPRVVPSSYYRPISSPLEIPGLVQWLDAGVGVYSDAGTTPITDGGTAEQWNDQSGKGNNVTQVTGADRPVWHSSKLNGRPALTFDGAATYLNNPYIGEPGTVLVVHRLNSYTQNFQQLMGADTSDAVAVGSYSCYASYNGGTPNRLFTRFTTLDSSAVGLLTARGNTELNQWGVFGASFGNNSLSMFKGAAQCGPGVVPTAAVRPINTATIGCGYYNSAVADFFNGDIAEIIVFPTPVSPADYYRLVRYLGAKYAIDCDGNYIWPCFKAAGSGSIDRKAYALQSPDGINWRPRPINTTNPSLYVDVPSLLPPLNGTWWMSFNDNNQAHTINIMNSTDGFNFGNSTEIDVSSVLGTNGDSWAPKFVRNLDGSIYLDNSGIPHILFAGQTDGTKNLLQIYELHPNSSDSSTWTTGSNWSAPVAISGTGFSASTLDPFCYFNNGTFYLWCVQNVGTRSIQLATSTSLTSGYTVIHTGNWAGWNTNSPTDLEAPQVLWLGGTHLRIYLDSTAGIYYSDSYNMETGPWSAKQITNIQPDASWIPQHGTPVVVSTPPMWTV